MLLHGAQLALRQPLAQREKRLWPPSFDESTIFSTKRRNFGEKCTKETLRIPVTAGPVALCPPISRAQARLTDDAKRHTL